jgi:hypothetical protein
MAPAYAKSVRPGAPKAVQAVSVDTAIAVSWTPPTSDGGSPITGYRVTATSAKPGVETCVTNGATACTVTGLINGQRYVIKVRASNAGGEGKASARIKGTPSTTQDCSYFGADANLQDCDVSYVNLTSADLSNANLTGAHLTEVTLTDANLTDANLTNAALLGVIFQSANLSGANLTDANLGAHDEAYLVDFEFANLTDTDLQGASAAFANFQYAALTDTDLGDADLSFGDLQGAVVSGVTVTGVTWDETTCPDGTNSDAYNPQTCAFDL